MILDRLVELASSLGDWLYLILGFLAFAEAAIMLGFVLPGETALLAGGVLAAEGVLDIRIMFVVAVVCAIVGDSVGYEVGKVLGPRLETSWLGRRVGQKRWDTAQAFLDKHGGKAVFMGRSIALLRALVPGLAGMSGMQYRRFLGWNALGGFLWGGGCVLLGYFFAKSIRRVEQYLTYGGLILFVVVVSGFVIAHIIGKRRERRIMDSSSQVRA
ncbi:unannotated protein [freshwater metagenome]|uniref:Unannotated protein n=1 Tax=freshwater metagenome TaxID=449393 RepID=A0A6J6INZ5_9ZZZZ